MKSFIKTLSIALGSAFLSIFIYDVYFKTHSKVASKDLGFLYAVTLGGYLGEYLGNAETHNLNKKKTPCK